MLDDRGLLWLQPASVRYSLLELRGKADIRPIVEFWRGDLSLGRAFWIWGIVGGGVASLSATLLA